MKKTLSLCSAIALCTALNAADSGKFSKGGVSIDFSKTFKSKKAAGKNFLFDGGFEEKKLAGNPWNQWQKHYYIHAPKHEVPDKKAMQAKLAPFVTQKIISSDSGKYLELSSSSDIMKYRPKGKPMLSNRVTQYIDLPPLSAPAKFQLSLKYRGKLENVLGLNSFRAFAFFKDNVKIYKSKNTRKMVNHAFKVNGKWTNGTVSFIVPPNTKKLGISLALYGCGKIDIDDVKLVKVKAADGVVAKLIPCSFLDKTFVVSQNDPAIMAFAFKNEKNTKISNPYLCIKLPAGFNIIDQRNILDMTVEKNDGYSIYKLDLSKLAKSFGKENFKTYQLASAMLKASVKSGEKTYPASYWYQDGDYRTEPEMIKLKVIPEIKGRQPKIFQTGAMVRREADFVAKGVKEFTDFYKKTGFNVVHGRSTPQINAAYKKNGLLRYTQPYFLCNGYRIGINNKPDDVKFQLADGSYRTKPHQAICPVAVYNQSPYYKNEVVGMLKKMLVDSDAADSIMPNWEPYMFDFKGCFCPRCKEEFIKYSGLDKTEVNKYWPAKIIIKYKYEWMKFRSWQHAKMCVQFEKDISEIGKKAGKNAHFVPEIAWSQLLENSNPHFAQYNPKDYMDKLPWLEPWGPYIFYKFNEPYTYNPGIHLITFTAAKEIKKFVERNIKDESKRPKLIAFPHGYQLDTWVTEPEALSFEFLCFFLNGWEGAIAYVFPKGYDNRWWKSLADANTRIAEYEDYVFKGQKSNDCEISTANPVPKANFPKFWSEGGNFMQKLPTLKDAEIVQKVEYKLGEKRLVAIGNFWQKSEVFVKLKVNKLAPGKYVLREPDFNRCYGRSLSAAELKKGVMVQVGALRWGFFVLEPYNESAKYGKVISPEFMRELFKKRLPGIKKAIQWEQKYQKEQQAQAARDNALPDYSNIKNMSNKGVSCRKSGNNIEFIWTGNKAIVDPVNGARIKSWVSGKTELVSQSGNLGFCVDAFWWPGKAACQITRPYRVLNQKKTVDGLSITLERKLDIKDKVYLVDFVINKTFDFSKDGIKVTTKITNTTGVSKELSFRWHNMPALLEFRGAKGGSALFEENGRDTVFKRIFSRKMLRYTDKRDNDLEGCFKLEQATKISKPEVIFSSTWSPVKLAADVGCADKLYGVVMWDSGKQKTTTFEPLFKKTSIAPGKSWEASMTWTVKK